MIQVMRMLALSMLGAVVLIGVALFFVVGTVGGGLDEPDSGALGVVLLVGIAVNVLIPLLGYRAPAVPPAAERASWVTQFQASMLLRLALGEVTALIALALAFVVNQGGLLLYLIGAAFALVTMAVHGFPWDYPIERYRTRLERDGGTSYLREDLGLPPRISGAIQEH